MKDESTILEYGRVSAQCVERFDEITRRVNNIWLPQIELIRYRPSDGKVINQSFACISDKFSKSGVIECNSEIDALKYAIDCRDI